MRYRVYQLGFYPMPGVDSALELARFDDPEPSRSEVTKLVGWLLLENTIIQLWDNHRRTEVWRYQVQGLGGDNEG
jgi:hypothetical protein